MSTGDQEPSLESGEEVAGVSGQTVGGAGPDCPTDGRRTQFGVAPRSFVLRHRSVAHQQYPRVPRSGRSPTLPPSPLSQLSSH